MNRSRSRAAVLAIAAVLLMPVVSWAHARTMLAEMPCANAAMPEHPGHGTGVPADEQAPDHQGDCCDTCFICTPMVALPPAPSVVLAGLVIRDLPVAIRPTTSRRVSLAAHVLPFPLGPPPAHA